LSGYTGTSFNIIGSYTPWLPFSGVFDGNGHTISNFTYESNDTDNIGLFGYVIDPNAKITDLTLIDPNVDVGTGDEVGSLVGYLKYGGVYGCGVKGGSVSGDNAVGGLVGYYYGGTISNISNCYVTSSVSGNERVGGESKTTAEMKKESTFTNAEWDFVEIWDIGENQTYPFLRTHLPSDINKDDETNFLDLAILAEHWLDNR